MNDHPQFDEDFDLYAVGALDAEERQALETHVATCAECQPRGREAHARLALLALTAAPATPPAGTRERLLAQIRPQPRSEPAARAGFFWHWAAPALALASVALGVALWVRTNENRELARAVAELRAELDAQRAESARARTVLEILTAPETRKVSLIAATEKPVPQGKVFYHAQKGLLFYAANLPALSAQQTYQLWLLPVEGNPISAGVFQADARGNGEVVLPSLPGGVAAHAFAVTVEPAGGKPQPTGPKVLVGLVS